MNNTVSCTISDASPNSLFVHYYCCNHSCTNHFTTCTSTIVCSEEYDWTVRFQCSICNSVWWLCNTCKLRKKLTLNSQLVTHNAQAHSKKVVSDRKRIRNSTDIAVDVVVDNAYITTTSIQVVDINANEMDISNNEQSDEQSDLNDVANTLLDMIHKKDSEVSNGVNNSVMEYCRTTMIDVLESKDKIVPTNKKTTEYYAYDIMSCGKKYLISKMWANEDGNISDAFKAISNEEVDCQLNMATFIQSLSRSQRGDFVNVIQDISNVYWKKEVQPVCKLPTTYSELRRLYVDGTESVLKNLPIPDVKELKKHSYVSIKHCVADFMYSNKHLLTTLDEFIDMQDELPDMTTFGNNVIRNIVSEASDRSKDMKVVDNNKIVMLFFKIWSDDFDPNNSIKSNRQSVWVKTISIVARLKDGKKLSYTYPISTAAKGEEHDEVDVLIGRELDDFRCGKFLTFYCRFMLQPVFVHGGVFCILADQPERRTLLHLSAGNSNNHKRFGYLLDYEQCLDVIHACDECQLIVDTEVDKYISRFEKILDDDSKMILSTRCPNCSNWMLFNDHCLLTYEPDKNYPVSMIDNTDGTIHYTNGRLKVKKITRDHLRKCIGIVQHHLEHDIWSMATARSFLKVEGFHQKSIERLTTKDETIEFFTNKYMQRNVPYSWYHYNDTDGYVDVPMHLLLLGISKAVFIQIIKWLKTKLKSVEFKKLAKSKLQQLKTYNLEWCKIINYPSGKSDKFGGWIAENFLGFVRISNWFYSLLLQLKEKKDLTILDKPRNQWKFKENKLWLEVRGLSTEGKANEIKDRVQGYMNMIDIPPIITTQQESIDNVLTLIDLQTDMIGNLMSASTLYDEIDYIELLIRKFLNYYSKLDKEVVRKKNIPSWMTQYNFLCLLNIPNIMRQYGSCRNIWEGSIEGEGFLRRYKREMRNGLTNKWQIWTINNLLQRNVFNKESLETEKHWKEKLAWECRIYKKKTTMNSIITDGKPISGIYLNNTNQIIITFRANKIIKGIILYINWQFYEWCCNMKYYKIKDHDNVVTISEEMVNQSTGCLLLPKLTSDTIVLPLQYCIVFSDWRKI